MDDRGAAPRKRFSIGLLMAIVFIVALDLAILKALWPFPWPGPFVALITLPTANVLLLASPRCRRGRSAGRSWLGFELDGWGMVLVFAWCAWCFPGTFLAPVEWFGRLLGPGPFSTVAIAFGFALPIASYTAPQRLVAVVVGWFAQGYRLIWVLRPDPHPIGSIREASTSADGR